MSENLDLVRSIYADWERGDFSSLEWADPEIEYTVVGGPAHGSWIGVTAMTDVTRDHIRGLEGFHIAVDECRELDGERVLLLWRFRGRGKASGIDAAEIPGGRHRRIPVRYPARQGDEADLLHESRPRRRRPRPRGVAGCRRRTWRRSAA